MPSIKYINQSAPFWDFIANMEQNGAQHPFAQAFGAGENEEQQSYGWGPFGGFPHRPHPNHHRGGLRGRHGPPGGPHGRRGPQPPPEGFGSGSGPSDGEFSEGEVSPPKYDEKEGSPATEKGEPSNAPHADECHEGRRGKCNGRKGEKGERAHSHGRRGPHGPHGPHGFHGKRGGPGGPGGPHGFGGRGPPWARRGGFPFGEFGGSWGDFFNQTRNEASEQNNFKPEVDVFDTETAYVVHLSLPGAKKEDVGVSWDSEKSQLTVSGVVHRPGDEEFLQTLALDERKVGAFEREVRLGSLANPASVDVDAISAKLEDGILRIEVPKLDKDYIEVKMVDIE